MVDLNEKIIKLVEVANTWQGEGPNTGRQMMISRFKHCNKSCHFCDTMIKMRTFTEGSYSINDLNEALVKTRGLMITGGEPTMQTNSIKNLDQTILMMKYCECQVINVETNGCNIEELLYETVDSKTFQSKASDIYIMYSPKVFSDYDYDMEMKKVTRVISNPHVYLKIVADGTSRVNDFVKEVSKLAKHNGQIYLMPLGVTIEEITKNWDLCINLADECNVNISTRMHIMNSFT